MAAAKFKPVSEWQGVVTHVSDGDTLFVRPGAGGQPVKIRMEGLDAPEICQAYGLASRLALQSRVMGQTVSVDARRRDNYGRVLARIRWQQADVGGWMVQQGHAWSYRFRRDVGPYAAQEAQARTARRGLFADAQAVLPREFRKQHGPCQEPGARPRAR
jgi:micrococcal nuclease